ncbi:hypothetical protein AB0C96_10700 [Streptomyces sp. NPDC048506]|uniref:hypothetical protein n=1 Tax=Streptomyces sp. NPDC048506 TaxID=3155028 RepID=UPI003430A16D
MPPPDRPSHPDTRAPRGERRRRRGAGRRYGVGGLTRLGAGVLATAFLVMAGALALSATAPPASAHDRLDRLDRLNRPSTGDNCAFAGTGPQVDVPTGFPMPRGWHFPCTKATHPPAPTRPPAPRPRSPEPAPPPPPPPRPTPRRPPPPPPPSPTHHARPTPPPPTPETLELPVPPVPAVPRSYPGAPHRPHHRRSVVTTTLLLTAPAVLAGAALRPRSSSSSGSAGRRSS